MRKKIILIAAIAISSAYPDVAHKQKNLPEQRMGLHEIALPTGRLCNEVPWGGFAVGTFLYWKANQDDFNFGLLYHTDADYATQGEIIGKSFDYRPAFRVGGGLKTPYDFGDLTFLWTKYSNHLQKSLSFSDTDMGVPPFTYIYPSFFGIGAQSRLMEGAAKLRMQDFDLDWSRLTKLTPHLSFTPRFGVRYSKIKETIRANFIPRLVPDQLMVAKDTGSFRGWGMKAGADFKWVIPYGMSVFTQLSGNMYWGLQKFTLFSDATALGPLHSINSLQGKYHRIRPMFNFVFGLAGNWCFANRFVARVSAGYEFQYWVGIYERASAGDISNQPLFSNDLSLQGYNFSGGIDF